MKKLAFLLFANSLIINGLAAQTDKNPNAVLPRFDPTLSQKNNSAAKKMIDQKANEIESKVIAWRHDFHQNPELSNREFKTAEKVAAHLKSLGLEVKTGVGKTGVVAILRGEKAGGTIALRADMDALPVTERNDLPYKSIQKATYLNKEVGVMHACGHDTHVAMLMGAAEILTGMKSEIAGNIVFVFQPAEEGPPPGEEGGALLMMKENLFEDYKIESFFGIHISSMVPVGTIKYKTGGAMAAADRFTVRVNGKGTHGSSPWSGADPIVASAYIITALQTVVSRQTELTKEAAVVTVGKISGGERHNIIPEYVEMLGTIRTLDEKMREKLLKDVRRIIENTAEAQGCTAEITFDPGLPITFNDVDLTKKMVATLEQVAGEQNVRVTVASTGSEDFSFFAQKVPSVFISLGGMAKGKDAIDAGPHHTPLFTVEDEAMKLGVRTHCYYALDWLAQRPATLPSGGK